MKNRLTILHLDCPEGTNAADDGVLVFDATTGAHGIVKAEQLLQLAVSLNKDEADLEFFINQISGEQDSAPFSPIEDGLWWRYNWFPSILHHASAAWVQGLDKADPKGEIRSSLLDRYREQGALPTRYVPPTISIPLPLPIDESPIELEAAFRQRRTQRSFSGRPATLMQLSAVTWMGFRLVRNTRDAAKVERLGELVSFGVGLEPFVVVHAVEEIAPGVYHYDIEKHRLSLIRREVSRRWIYKLFNKQSAPKTASFSLFLVLSIPQILWRYRHERAFVNQFLDAGRVAQSLIIAGERNELGSFITPALCDAGVRHLLRLKLEEFYPLHAISMGSKKVRRRER